MTLKCWIVPSHLFVPGQIYAPARLLREKADMVARKAKLEAELAGLPAKIEAADQEITRLVDEYKPFRPMEMR